MASERVRRLAAVWFADIVGYTKLSARREDAALAIVDELQAAARTAAEASSGRIVKFVGDAALATFESADSALRAALALREAFGKAPVATEYGCQLRIGIHLGEVVEASDGDIYGDGVNVASRVQGQAAPGQLVATRAVVELIRGRPDFHVESMAPWHRLKGLGFTKLFVVRGADEPRAAPRLISRERAVAVGVTGGVVAFIGMVLAVGFSLSNGSGGGAEAAGEAATTLDAEYELGLGVEHYFAGEPEQAVQTLGVFREQPMRDAPEAQSALRYLARTYLEMTPPRPEEARDAVESLVAREPPMELLIPTVEEADLIDLYYDVRTDTRRSSEGTPVEGIVVFDLRFASDVDDPSLADVGASVSQMLVSELEEAGYAVRYPWEVIMGYPGESAYRYFEDRILSGGSLHATHTMLGRVAVRGDQLSISARIYEMATGGVVVSEVVTGAWPDSLFDLVEQLGEALGRELASIG